MSGLGFLHTITVTQTSKPLKSKASKKHPKVNVVKNASINNLLESHHFALNDELSNIKIKIEKALIGLESRLHTCEEMLNHIKKFVDSPSSEKSHISLTQLSPQPPLQPPLQPPPLQPPPLQTSSLKPMSPQQIFPDQKTEETGLSFLRELKEKVERRKQLNDANNTFVYKE